MVDCVAVLGALPASADTALADVPFSGVAREKLLGALTDEEAAQLCNFEACMTTNGYRRKCYNSTYGVGSGTYQVNSVAIVAPVMETCFPVANVQPQDSSNSMEECTDLYRTYFATCHVGRWEDCLRESVRTPFGAWTWVAPDCLINHQECPVN
jgi:hypothetical protein